MATEVPLEALAARYSDSEDEGEGRQHGAEPQAAVPTPPPVPAAAGAGAPPGAAEASGSGSEDWDEEEDWDSEDEELASALEWADLREGGGGSGRCLMPAARCSACDAPVLTKRTTCPLLAPQCKRRGATPAAAAA